MRHHWFNRLLGFPGTVAEKGVFDATHIVIDVRQQSHAELPGGLASTATYDRSRRSWRHLDMAATR